MTVFCEILYILYENACMHSLLLLVYAISFFISLMLIWIIFYLVASFFHCAFSFWLAGRTDLKLYSISSAFQDFILSPTS